MDAAATRAAGAARMKAVATGLLLLMAILFLGATWGIAHVDPRFVWVQAFAEAAMIGGLADWFAVTALFRHPMGLPIPHTAIIPRSKDRIGDALATFLKDNFLTPKNVARRLDGFDAAQTLAGFLERPASTGRIRRGIAQLMGQLWDSDAGRAVTARLQQGTLDRLRDTEVSPLLGRMLEAVVAEGRHRPVIDGLIAWAGRTLDSQEGLIRAMVEERTSWVLRLVNVDERIAGELVGGLRALLADLAGDPNHPVREKADRALANLAFDLQFLPETREKVEQLKRDLIANPALGEWLDGIWGRLKMRLVAMAHGGGPGEGLGDGPGDGLGDIGPSMARALRGDPALAGAINQLARRSLVGLVSDHGDRIVALVSDTVKGWDTATITDKLESAVSRDLQYIRLNGTLIGGSIGVGLHAVLVLAGAA